MKNNMKKIFFGILFISFIGFAQEMSYEIRGKYAKSVKRKHLKRRIILMILFHIIHQVG